jgi:hypothetical protein
MAQFLPGLRDPRKNPTFSLRLDAHGNLVGSACPQAANLSIPEFIQCTQRAKETVYAPVAGHFQALVDHCVQMFDQYDPADVMSYFDAMRQGYADDPSSFDLSTPSIPLMHQHLIVPSMLRMHRAPPPAVVPSSRSSSFRSSLQKGGGGGGGGGSSSDDNRPGVPCRNFAKGDCHWPQCRRDHYCTHPKCSKDYGRAPKCPAGHVSRKKGGGGGRGD